MMFHIYDWVEKTDEEISAITTCMYDQFKKDIVPTMLQNIDSNNNLVEAQHEVFKQFGYVVRNKILEVPNSTPAFLEKVIISLGIVGDYFK